MVEGGIVYVVKLYVQLFSILIIVVVVDGGGGGGIILLFLHAFPLLNLYFQARSPLPGEDAQRSRFMNTTTLYFLAIFYVYEGVH